MFSPREELQAFLSLSGLKSPGGSGNVKADFRANWEVLRFLHMSCIWPMEVANDVVVYPS